MKQLLTMLLLSVALTSCTTGKGTSEVKLIDVTWEGLFFQTCEVHGQYGTGSSTIGAFSSEDKELCDKLIAANGKNVKLNYIQTTFVCPTCKAMGDLIQSFEVR